MSTTHEQLTAALADVRRAYRLIQTYQKRLWDLLGSVDDKLSHAGLPFVRWRPMNVAMPPKGGTRFFVERWAWDFVPAYQIGCEWQQIDMHRNLARRVFIIANADTGYDATQNNEPDPASFKPAEACSTTLRIGMWTAHTTSPDWEGALRERGAEDNLPEAKHYTFSVKGTKYTCELFPVDVANLIDENTVQAKLLQPIETWLAKTVP